MAVCCVLPSTDSKQLFSQVELIKDSTTRAIIGAHTYIILQIGQGLEVQVHGGGDAAAASAEGGREGPAGKYGCCAYCVLRKVSKQRAASPWFDEKACAEAQRRTCWLEHCRAHERPPGCPDGHDPKCPDCDFVCSKQAVLKSRTRREDMSASALAQHDRERRRSHAGAEEHRPQLAWIDHKYRVPSALHLMLNGVGTNIAVTLAAGATPAILRAINVELSRPEHNLYWRVREDKKGRDIRPNGPECRKLLFTPGLIHKLLSIRFEKAILKDLAIPPLQTRGAPLLQAVQSRSSVLPARKAQPKAAMQGVPPVQSRQINAGAVLKALGGLNARPAATSTASANTSTEPPPPDADTNTMVTSTAQAQAVYDSNSEDEYEAGFDIPSEVEEDVQGALLVWSTFMELMLELHEEWDDHDLEERKRRGKVAEQLGKQWALAVRRHSKFTCVHYYCHVAYAHLRELIECNGHLFSGDDAILERGHQVFKRLRAITSSGGKPVHSVTGARPRMKMVRNRHKKNGGGLETHVVEAPIRGTAQEQLFRLARAATVRAAARRAQAPRPSALAMATELRIQQARREVKEESSRQLKMIGLSSDTPHVS